MRSGIFDNEIINENLELIESSKDSLKKYINLYVERIETQMHNSKFTVLRVFYKIHGNLNFKKSFDGELDDAMLLVIDKRVTQKIKLFKSKFYLCHILKFYCFWVTASSQYILLLNHTVFNLI